MSILVTGAGGIGLATARTLHEAGEHVVLLDISTPTAIPPGVDFVRCDVTDGDELNALLGGAAVDGIVHTAALLSDAIRQNPLRGYRVNVLGTANILETARIYGVRRVVLAGSTTVEYSIFGHFRGATIPEDFTTRVLSDRPRSIYAATKLANENLGMLYGDLYGLDVVILRYAAVLNPWAGALTSVPGRLVDTLVRAGQSGRPVTIDDPLLLWSGKEEFIDARDCVRANVTALRCPSPQQRVYSIAGEAQTFDEFVGAVQSLYPELVVERPVGTTSGFAGFPHERPAPSATDAAERELEFTPLYSLTDSITSYIEALENVHGR